MWWPDAGAPSWVLFRLALGLCLEISLAPQHDQPETEGVLKTQDFQC